MPYEQLGDFPALGYSCLKPEEIRRDGGDPRHHFHPNCIPSGVARIIDVKIVQVPNDPALRPVCDHCLVVL